MWSQLVVHLSDPYYFVCVSLHDKEEGLGALFVLVILQPLP